MPSAYFSSDHCCPECRGVTIARAGHVSVSHGYTCSLIPGGAKWRTAVAALRRRVLVSRIHQVMTGITT